MRLREELEEYKRREELEKSHLPPQVSATAKELEAKIEERLRLDEQFEREREERARQLAIAREQKRLLKPSVMDSTAKSTASPSATPTKRYSPPTIEEDLANKFIPNATMNSDDDDDDDEGYGDDLRFNNTTAAALPQFDRSTKPNLRPASRETQSPNIYALQGTSRQRDFSPVPGSIVSNKHVLLLFCYFLKLASKAIFSLFFCSRFFLY